MILGSASQPRCRWIAGLLLLLLGGLYSIQPARAQTPITITAEPVTLNISDPEQTHAGALRWVSGVVLTSSKDRFGGLSDLVVDDQGQHLLAVTDKGNWLSAEIVYDAEGQITGLSNATLTPLLATNGKYLYGKAWQDAEALTRLPDGDLLVGFERRHRLWRYQIVEGEPRGAAFAWPLAPGLDQAPDNKGLEALVAFPDGQLFALAEHSGDGESTAAWLWQGGRWWDMTYRTSDGFDPTASTRLANGDILVLERYFSVLAGPAARLKRIAADSLYPGAVIEGEEIALLAPPQTVDNMEGLATWQNEAGETLVLLLADDNFNPLQQTLLLLFVLES